MARPWCSPLCSRTLNVPDERPVVVLSLHFASHPYGRFILARALSDIKRLNYGCIALLVLSKWLVWDRRPRIAPTYHLGQPLTAIEIRNDAGSLDVRD